MSREQLGLEDLEALRRFDTPTICNALEVFAPEHRTVGFTTEPLVCADTSLPPIVGFVCTATIRAAAAISAEEARKRRMDYYEYVDRTPHPTVTVIQDLDPNPGLGAFWGEVNTTIHKSLGCIGAVTNGSIRDLGALAPGFQLLGAKVGPSHAHVHVVDFGGPVNVFGMTVGHGDLIHADRHGAVVIPAKRARDLPKAVDLILRRERVILKACRSSGFTVQILKKAMADAAEIQ